jgi:hypothetical protein
MMYPVNVGYEGAIERINNLMANGHHAEALVTTVFTMEKTLRRTLRQMVVSAGFRSVIAEKIVKDLRGFDGIKKAWEIYEPEHRTLPHIVGNDDWKILQHSAAMRNKFVHGERVFHLSVCRNQTNSTLAALARVKEKLDREYGYSGWDRIKVRKKSRLHVDPVSQWQKRVPAKTIS